MSRKSGNRFSEKGMRKCKNLERIPIQWDALQFISGSKGAVLWRDGTCARSRKMWPDSIELDGLSGRGGDARHGLFHDRQVDHGGKHAEQDRQPPDHVIGAGLLEQQSTEPHAEEAADLVTE